jgi:chemotaxis protein methyltransferase CheR
MVLSEEAERAPGFRFQIVGTDLSTRVLRSARAGIYREHQVSPVPVELRQKYLLRSMEDVDEVRVRRGIRDMVELRQLNLLSRTYEMHPPMDVIFCRNVFIYFERDTQNEILARFAASLAPGGFLFLGHSETITDAGVAFAQVGPTVWRLREQAR